MFNKQFLITIIIFSLIFSVGVVSASEFNETSYLGDSSDDVLVVDLNQQKIQEDINVGLSGDNSQDIYVDENGDSISGNGTKENPVTTLDSARNCVKEYKEEITVNINDGNYTIGDLLQFNTSNLHIKSVGNNVIIKNLLNTNSAKQAFGLLESNNGNFTMSNVIFDGSSWTQRNGKSCYFTPFVNGVNNFVRFDNCTFIGFDGNVFLLPYSTKSVNNNNVYEFDNCKFVNYTNTANMGAAFGCNVTFANCIFSAEYTSGLGMDKAETVIFDSCWFGYNNFNDNRMFTNLNSETGEIKFRQAMTNGLYKFTRYAIFDVSENYLGGNVYEIVGKLMWNDTTNDNIDKLGPMTVYLSADNGDIPKTATLENGIFKVKYISESDSHEITAVLDHQIIKLNNNINFTVNSPSIQYGENQNVTVTFQNNVNGTVYVTVNNKTYKVYLDDKNVTVVSIEDKLPKGTHDVNVKFESDNENYVINLGFNTTKLTVIGLSDYDFNATVTPTVYLGDNATVTLSLPVGANGTVTVKVGDNDAKTFNVNETITIDGFVAGENVVNITYNGNDIYDAKSVVKNIFALDKPTITIPEIVAGKATTTTITLPQNATGNVTVFVDGKEYSVVNLTNGSATVTIPELPAGKHNLTISYSGDDNYAGFAQTSAVEVKEPAKPTPKPDDQKPATVKKTATKITAKKKTFKAKTKVKKYTITLKAGKKAVKKVQVILKIGKKTYKAKTNAKGKATFKIKKLTKKGKYTAKITFKGNKLYKATTKKVKITVKK